MTFAQQVNALIAALLSHAQLTGLFQNVISHEPKTAPQNGMTFAMSVVSMDPVPSSGLAETSARIVFNVRIYNNMLAEPQDAIDPDVVSATCVLMGEYSGNFSLAGTVRNIDLMGENGESLSANAGYLSQDNKMFRVMDITLPIIINDMFGQVN